MAVPAAFREKLAFYFDDFDTATGRVINFLITGLILASCGIFVAQTYLLPTTIQSWLSWFDNGIFVVFTLEYLLRLWAAPKRTQHFLKLSSLIDLVVLLPFLLGTTTLGFLRIFRWLRILRLIRFFEQQTLFGVNREDGVIAVRILFTIFAIIFVYSGLIYQVEHGINPEQFGTFLDAVYYAVSSISTAGFGDINPISQLGRLLSILMMLTGLVLIPWQLGDLFKRFVKDRDRQQITCAHCTLSLHDHDARYCKACGNQLNLPKPQPQSHELPVSNRTFT
ncbi:ion transporter [filamentous cyanobacterium LEGE 11480]|uniref:Ion transporter n=1 Tax=Romeriopsis navalis LEGE 11480 TaxID=2777977 RepID=A0A928VIY9_9CYAN|nr:ion transporter [Romeriopsis navalis]MBE9029466.1 ion transporter [Romeriopsis navalis LEGE 11480]